MTATVSRIRLSLVWTRLVDEALEDPYGPLTSGPGYRQAFSARVGDLLVRPPWIHGDASWSRFWSSYLGSPRQLRAPDLDAMWDHLVPLAGAVSTFTGPNQCVGDLQALLYPHAIAVVATIEVEGSWPVTDLATAVASLRSAHGFGSHGPPNRSIDGLAGDLADSAARFVAPRAATAGVSDPLAVVAPLEASGDATAFAIDSSDVASCIAGLATMGPAGTVDQKRFLDVNTDANLRARIYATSRGVVIWRADSMLDDPPGAAVDCLHRNHTSALAHVEALATLVTWAAEGGDVAPEIRPLLGRALLRLDQLELGNRKKTYRSGIVQKRVAPHRAAIDDLRNRTGLGRGL